MAGSNTPFIAFLPRLQLKFEIVPDLSIRQIVSNSLTSTSLRVNPMLEESVKLNANVCPVKTAELTKTLRLLSN